MDTASASVSSKEAASQLAHTVIGKNPKTWGILVIAMIVVIIILLVICVVYYNRFSACEATAKKAGFTGGNNSQWQGGSQHAGAGGSMDSSYHAGDSRVYAASAGPGPATMSVRPVLKQTCSATPDPMAVQELNTLFADGGARTRLSPGSLAAGSDDDLANALHGGD